MQIFGCVFSSGARVIIRAQGHLRRRCPSPSPQMTLWLMLIDQSASMVIPIIRNWTTSADTGPWTKNIPGKVCHHAPQLAMTCCRKQLLIQQEAHAPQVAPSVPKNIRMEELLTASTHPLISVSCKYHLRLPRRHSPGGCSASQSPLCSDTQVVLLFTHLKITWKCQVTIRSIHCRVQWGPGPNKSITDNYMHLSPPSACSLLLCCPGAI